MRLRVGGVVSKQSECPQITAEIKTVLGEGRSEVKSLSESCFSFSTLSNYPKKHMTSLSSDISGYINTLFFHPKTENTLFLIFCLSRSVTPYLPVCSWSQKALRRQTVEACVGAPLSEKQMYFLIVAF